MHLIVRPEYKQYTACIFRVCLPMRLSDYTDYTLRVLMYCAAHPDRLVTIAEIAEGHQVSKNHLMKIVNDLARQGVIETTRGRGGGLRLLQAPADIRIGDVVRETDFYRDDHRRIFRHIGKLIQMGRPADVVTVYEQLQGLGKADEVGGIAYLNSLAQYVPSASNSISTSGR